MVLTKEYFRCPWVFVSFILLTSPSTVRAQRGSHVRRLGKTEKNQGGKMGGDNVHDGGGSMDSGGVDNGDNYSGVVCFDDTQDLYKAVDEYVAASESEFGQIGTWCVSKITSFSKVFSAERNQDLVYFNDDISQWDVSRASDMSEMFYGATAFNQDVSGWDVGKVKDMQAMFAEATSFHSDVSVWNVKKVKDTTNMFQGASSFNSDISTWEVTKLESMKEMFLDATSFDQNLCPWADILDEKVEIKSAFTGSACSNQDDPNYIEGGPFCYSCSGDDQPPPPPPPPPTPPVAAPTPASPTIAPTTKSRSATSLSTEPTTLTANPTPGRVILTPQPTTPFPTMSPTASAKPTAVKIVLTTAPTTAAPTSRMITLTGKPTPAPTGRPTSIPSQIPTGTPSSSPTGFPTTSVAPSWRPSASPTAFPTQTVQPSGVPTTSALPTGTSDPTSGPSKAPSPPPTSTPSYIPTNPPSGLPTCSNKWRVTMQGRNRLTFQLGIPPGVQPVNGDMPQLEASTVVYFDLVIPVFFQSSDYLSSTMEISSFTYNPIGQLNFLPDMTYNYEANLDFQSCETPDVDFLYQILQFGQQYTIILQATPGAEFQQWVIFSQIDLRGAPIVTEI